MKNNIIEYGSFVIIAMGGIFLIYGKNSKFLNFPAFVGILGTRYMGKLITVMMQEDKAGGTTPHNPLKIPKKV